MTRQLPGPPAPPLFGWRGNALMFGRDPVAFLRLLRNETQLTCYAPPALAHPVPGPAFRNLLQSNLR